MIKSILPLNKATLAFSTILLVLLANFNSAIDLGENQNHHWQEQTFLPAHEAFPLKASLSSTKSETMISITWDITPGHYLYAETIKLDVDNNNQNQSHVTPRFSETATVKFDPNFERDMEIFTGQVTAHFSFNLENNSGASLSQLALFYQGCAEAGLCYPMQSILLSELLEFDETPNTSTKSKPSKGSLEHPEKFETKNTNTDISTSLDTTSTTGPSENKFQHLLSDASLTKIFFIFLVLGIGLCFTPCVLPMMPIISSLVLGREKKLSSWEAFGISSTYVLSMTLCYTLIGVLAASLGASANLQIWMQHPIILSVFAALFLLLALSMFDVYELRLPSVLNTKLNELSNQQNGGSYLSAAIMGVISALVVSPCISAPLAGALVFISATGDVLIGASALFALGLGMGLPLILLCTLGTNILPKAGDWLNHSKHVFGVLLIAVAIWMLSRFISPQITLGLWGGLFIFSSFSFGSWQKANPFLRTILSILLLWGVVMIIGAAMGNSKILQPLEHLSSSTADQSSKTSTALNTQNDTLRFVDIYSKADLNRELATNQASGSIMLVDFYADWCTACKELEHEIFENPQFKSFLSSAYLVRADLSDNTADNFDLLEELKLFGPPAILFFNDQGQELEQFRIQGTISAEDFQNLINTLKAVSSGK